MAMERTGWRYAIPQWAMEVLLRGNPKEIGASGLVGLDADSDPRIAAAAEDAGFKSTGVPMTVNQQAKAMLAGVIPPETKIVSWPGDGVDDLESVS